MEISSRPIRLIKHTRTNLIDFKRPSQSIIVLVLAPSASCDGVNFTFTRLEDAQMRHTNAIMVEELLIDCTVQPTDYKIVDGVDSAKKILAVYYDRIASLRSRGQSRALKASRDCLVDNIEAIGELLLQNQRTVVS